MGGLNWEKVVHRHQGWRLISCIWLHAGLLHLLANMLSLVFIGIRLEQNFGFGNLWPHLIVSVSDHMNYKKACICLFSTHWHNISVVWIWWECAFCSLHKEQYLCWCIWCTLWASRGNAIRAHHKLVYIYEQGWSGHIHVILGLRSKI